MIKDEWYLNKPWNHLIDSNFEDQLKRTRNAGNKATYTNVKNILSNRFSIPKYSGTGRHNTS